ncbi:MAG: hypothetical protein A2845_03165 [Candidatus Lloydbacteria bacterium RIFCSPHIGHO2_01_FULL_49_22]|uniref:Uncharacterized protein n=1 Tax=Candidatus Lloydbacteria bacterium RIFCSPHIGHO2_01_FULL_49_22 TaxID=1798658 RepID=A0A1G2CXL1_9BACT|nr:MAG: hypothetical protein A2845_03165 [Candidatus Lloydbacteria bacterium RIFCSPHIGHO2_01_FULL_49_22]OGZ09880.1 MAG: hypothetical protein A3C14_03000 [Candidatus Lloydbacteria bacterium RIFCSPHIGHO2_02_FULL_50_18]
MFLSKEENPSAILSTASPQSTYPAKNSLFVCVTMLEPQFSMKRGILFVMGSMLLYGAFANTAFAGFGITPPYVHNDTLRPGSEYTQEIIIVRSDPVEDLNAELALNLPAIESWFSFDRGIKFVLPKGESQVKLHVTVRVPDDAKLGGYNGNIRIRTSSSAGQSTGVSLALGAQIDVQLKVVDQIFDFSVRRVELFEAEEGHQKWWLSFPGKVKFAMYIENIGNVPAIPYKVSLQIFDVSGQQLLETTENSNTVDSVLPFDTKKVVAYFPTWLPPGAYRVKYSIEKDETRNAQAGELALSILPRGTITGYEEYGFEGLKLSQQLSVILPIGTLALLIMFVMFFRMKKPRRRRERASNDDARHRDPPESESPRRPRSAASSGGVVDLSRRR